MSSVRLRRAHTLVTRTTDHVTKPAGSRDPKGAPDPLKRLSKNVAIPKKNSRDLETPKRNSRDCDPTKRLSQKLDASKRNSLNLSARSSPKRGSPHSATSPIKTAGIRSPFSDSSSVKSPLSCSPRDSSTPRAAYAKASSHTDLRSSGKAASHTDLRSTESYDTYSDTKSVSRLRLFSPPSSRHVVTPPDALRKHNSSTSLFLSRNRLTSDPGEETSSLKSRSFDNIFYSDHMTGRGGKPPYLPHTPVRSSPRFSSSESPKTGSDGSVGSGDVFEPPRFQHDQQRSSGSSDRHRLIDSSGDQRRSGSDDTHRLSGSSDYRAPSRRATPPPGMKHSVVSVMRPDRSPMPGRRASPGPGRASPGPGRGSPGPARRSGGSGSPVLGRRSSPVAGRRSSPLPARRASPGGDLRRASPRGLQQMLVDPATHPTE